MNRRRNRSADCHPIFSIFDSPDLRADAKPDNLAEVIEALEEKFPHNREHSDRVVEYARLIARELSIQGKHVITICRAACLHDVGKIAVPGEILTKPGALDEREREIIKRHPEAAARLLQALLYPQECIDLVYHHHEWFNGDGYPDHAEGSDIPLGSRVIAVADAFDAMTSDRPYRKAMSLEDAKKEICDCAGSQFDPEVVEALDRAHEKGILSNKS
ncbi:MAG: HD-GYP domain-containing protein [Chloroflexi bacterium]|nr:HD-GYP domain-containing protein [Chloroflexota bacterium]